MKIVNTFLSILIFFLTSILLYQVIYFGFIDSKKTENYISNIKLTDKVNLQIEEDNYFISNVNKTYRDLLLMKYGYKDIKNIEKYSNINSVISSIIIDKVNCLKNGKDIKNVYSKDELDKILINDNFNDELKDYIVSNDYKIVEFENELNNKIKNFNNSFKPFRFILDKISLIIVSIVVLILFIFLALNKKYHNFFAPLLISNFLNIIISIIILGLLNTKYEFKIVNYFFYNFILFILKKSVIISVIVILFTILFITIINIKNKKKLNKIKPRIRKVIKNEEDFGFGLW